MGRTACSWDACARTQPIGGVSATPLLYACAAVANMISSNSGRPAISLNSRMLGPAAGRRVRERAVMTTTARTRAVAWNGVGRRGRARA